MLNLITLQGRLTSDPEIRKTPSGVHLVSVIVACERPRIKDAEKVTDFIPCIAWAKNADFLTKYFRKGDMIIVAGRMQSRPYETQDGHKRIAYELSISESNFCGGKRPDTKEQDDYGEIDWDEVPDLPTEF